MGLFEFLMILASVVIGLGLIGIISMKLLEASGIKTFGLDINPDAVIRGHTVFGDILRRESTDRVYWGNKRPVMSKGRSGWWQGTKIGAGPIPIETKDGWLLFYHGVSGTCNGFVYSFGAAILDLDDPSKVLFRTRDYLLTPEKEYETVGFVPNVAFPCANLYDADTGRIAIYYGAADTYTAVAFTQVDLVLDYVKNNSEVF